MLKVLRNESETLFGGSDCPIVESGNRSAKIEEAAVGIRMGLDVVGGKISETDYGTRNTR